MMESTLTYIEENVLINSKFDLKSDDFNRPITFTTTKKKINSFYEYSCNREIENKLLYRIIKNLIKKTSFIQLSLQLTEDQITEDEFDMEIENNPEEYIIDLQYLDENINLFSINNIIKKIGKGFSIDEVSEMFAIDLSNVELKGIN